MSRLYRILALLVILSLACRWSAPEQTAVSQSTPKVVMVSRDPNAAATPTPFQPVQPTRHVAGGAIIQPTATPLSAGITPTVEVSATVTITPTAENTNPIPPAAKIKMPEGMVNILVLGSDFRPDAGFRTDVIVWLAINTKKGTVSALSFPRDLYVFIPGWEMQRINTAQQHGGFELTQEMFEYNFGIRPDHYIMANFYGFKAVVNSLGGIDVNAAYNLTDTCSIPDGAPTRNCSVGPGLIHMDGDLALWYARSRHSTSDFDRERRAQELIHALFNRMISLDALTRVPELYQAYSDNVETDLSLTDVLSLLPLATSLGDASSVQRYTITPAEVANWVTPEGAMVLVPNPEAIKALILKVFAE